MWFSMSANVGVLDAGGWTALKNASPEPSRGSCRSIGIRRSEPDRPTDAEHEQVLQRAHARLDELPGRPRVWQREVGELIRSLMTAGPRTPGEAYKVFLLTSPGDERTLRLDSPLLHAGKGAWVQNQRYTSVAALTAPGVLSTEDLDG